MSNLDDLIKNIKYGDLIEFEVEGFGKFSGFYWGVEEKERDEEFKGQSYLPLGELTDCFDEEYDMLRIGRLESKKQLRFNQCNPNGVDPPGEDYGLTNLPDVYVTSTDEGHSIAGRKINSGKILDNKNFINSSEEMHLINKGDLLQIKFPGNEQNIMVAYVATEWDCVLSPFQNKVILPWIVEKDIDKKIKLTFPLIDWVCKLNDVETGDQVWAGLVTGLVNYPIEEVRRYS